MALKYHSREWCDEAQRRLNSDQQHLADAKSLTGTVCFWICDCPDGTDLIAYWKFDKGKCLNKGQVSVLKLLTDPSYKIEGPKMDAMKHMKGLNSWNRVCQEIPTEE